MTGCLPHAEMTSQFSDKFEEFGAITPSEASDGIVKAMSDLKLETTGRFVAPQGSNSLGFSKDAVKETIEPFGDLPW
jgi:hypothetical protein